MVFFRKLNSPIVMKIYHYLGVFKNIFWKTFFIGVLYYLKCHYHLHCTIETKMIENVTFLISGMGNLCSDTHLRIVSPWIVCIPIYHSYLQKIQKCIKYFYLTSSIIFFYFKRNSKHNCYHSSKKRLWLNLIKYIMLKTFYIDQKPYMKKRTSGKFNAELLIEMFV